MSMHGTSLREILLRVSASWQEPKPDQAGADSSYTAFLRSRFPAIPLYLRRSGTGKDHETRTCMVLNRAGNAVRVHLSDPT